MNLRLGSLARLATRLAPFLVLQCLLGLLAWNFDFLLETLLDYDYESERLPKMFGGALVFGEFLVCLLMAGLVGRHWLTGYAAASLLLMVQACLFITGFSPEYASDMWAISCIPAVLVLAALPLFAARRLWGWCLTLTQRRTKTKPSIEDLFVTTLVLACCVVIYRLGISVASLEEVESSFEASAWIAGVVVGVISAILSAVLILPGLSIWFRSRPVVLKLVLSLVHLAIVTGLIVLVFHGAAVLTDGPPDWTSAVEFASFAALPGMFMLHFHLASLYLAGFRFRRLQTENSAELSDNTPRPTWRWLTTPRCIAVCMLIATTVSAILVQGKVKAVQRLAKLQQELVTLAEDSGGEFSNVLLDDSWTLRLWDGASDEALARFDAFQIDELDLSKTRVTAEGLRDRPNLGNLETLILSGTPEVRQSLQAVCEQAPHLSSVEIRDTPMKVSDLSPLFTSRRQGDLFSLTISGSQISRGDDQAFEHRRLITGLEAIGCGLTDEMIRGWIRKEAFKIDLSNNKLHGNLDFLQLEFDSANFSPWIDLSSNPLQDKVFGAAVVGIDLPDLVLLNTDLTDRFLPYLQQANSIHGLYLGEGNISEEALAAADPRGLQKLSLAGEQFTGHCFRDWHPRLTMLSLQGSSADNETLRYLSQLTDLETLLIDDTFITPEGLLELEIPLHVRIVLQVEKFTQDELAKLEEARPNLAWFH